MPTVLLWSFELRLSGSVTAPPPAAAARRLREMAASIERLPANLVVGMGDLPMGVGVAGAGSDVDWSGTWSVREDRDELGRAPAQAAVAP